MAYHRRGVFSGPWGPWEYLYEHRQSAKQQLHQHLLAQRLAGPEVLTQLEMFGGQDWKMWSMAAHQAHTNPTDEGRFLFIEDGPYLETRQWIDTVPHAAYLSTDTALGITAEQMAAIEAACAPGAGQAELDQVQSLSVEDHRHTMDEIYWVRGSYRPSDEKDLQRLTEWGFRPSQPRDMEAYNTMCQKRKEQIDRLIEERGMDADSTFVL